MRRHRWRPVLVAAKQVASSAPLEGCKPGGVEVFSLPGQGGDQRQPGPPQSRTAVDRPGRPVLGERHRTSPSPP